MTTIQLQHHITPDELFQGIEQLEADELEKLFSRLSLLRTQRRILTDQEQREVELLELINRSLSSNEAARFQALEVKYKSQRLTDKEHLELSKLWDQIELLDAERVIHLAELAELRNCSIDQLLDQLELRQ